MGKLLTSSILALGLLGFLYLSTPAFLNGSHLPLVQPVLADHVNCFDPSNAQEPHCGGSGTTTTSTQPNCFDPNNAQNPACSTGGILSILEDIKSFFTTGLLLVVAKVIYYATVTIRWVLMGTGGNTLSADASTNEIMEAGGALGMIGYLVQGLYDNPPPVSAGDYLATIHPITETFASSHPTGTVGQDALSPLIIPWILIRNVTYGLFILILVATGLMVMFRSKIDPRTVVTVQAALPNLVVSLVLITFSFALAGLVIDFGRLLQEVIRTLMVSSGMLPIDQQVGTTLSDMWRAFTFNNNNPVTFSESVNANPTNLISGLQTDLLNTLTAIAGEIVTIVILIFSFIISFQLFFILLFKYVGLLVKAVFAPLSFLVGALPGRGGTSAGWFRDYLADVLAFPAILFLLNLALFVKQYDLGVGNTDPFNLFGGSAGLGSLVALGILIFATKVPAAIEEALEAKHSGYVAGSGAKPEQLAKKVPIIGNFL